MKRLSVNTLLQYHVLNTLEAEQLYESIFTVWERAALKFFLPLPGVQLSISSCPIYKYLVGYRR